MESNGRKIFDLGKHDRPLQTGEEAVNLWSGKRGETDRLLNG